MAKLVISMNKCRTFKFKFRDEENLRPIEEDEIDMSDDTCPLGPGLLSKLADLLHSSDVETGRTVLHENYGWMMRVKYQGRRFRFLVQKPEHEIHMLSIEQEGYLNFLRAKKSLVESLDDISNLIRRWITTLDSGVNLGETDEWAPPSF